MHNPERDPFHEGRWADIREGIADVESGDVIDAEEVFAEFGLVWNAPIPDEPPLGVPPTSRHGTISRRSRRR